jgi:hypothetical protein
MNLRTARAREPLLPLILTCLEGQEQTAVALHEHIEQDYGLHVEPTTLLVALSEGEQRHWIVLCNDEPGRMCYGLTEAGERILMQRRDTTHRHLERIGVRDQTITRKETRMKPALWAVFLLRCYPRAWRQRYEPEMLALLEQHTITFITLCDLLLGAVDAYLDPTYRTARPFFGFTDLRSIAILFVCAFTCAFFNMITWTSLHPYVMGDVAGPLYTHLGHLCSLVLLPTLLLSNLLVVGMLVKKAQGSRRKQLLWPAFLCLALFFAAPLLFTDPNVHPVLTGRVGFPQSWHTIVRPGAPKIDISILPFYRMLTLTLAPLPDAYLENLLHLSPLLSVVLSSLFIALVIASKTSTKLRPAVLWLTTVVFVVFSLEFYFVPLPFGRHTNIYLRPFSTFLSLLLGVLVTLITAKIMSMKPHLRVVRLVWLLCLIVSASYLFLKIWEPRSILDFNYGPVIWTAEYGLEVLPYIVWPAAIVLFLARSDVSQLKGRLTLICGCVLALVMLLMLTTQLVTLPSSLHELQTDVYGIITANWMGSSTFLTVLVTNTLVTLAEVGIVLTMLIRGFIVLKTPPSLALSNVDQASIQAVQE